MPQTKLPPMNISYAKKPTYTDPFQLPANMWDAYIDKLKMIEDDIEGIKAWESSPDNPFNYGKKGDKAAEYGKKVAQRPRKMRTPEKPIAGK